MNGMASGRLLPDLGFSPTRDRMRGPCDDSWGFVQAFLDTKAVVVWAPELWLLPRAPLLNFLTLKQGWDGEVVSSGHLLSQLLGSTQEERQALGEQSPHA